MCETATATQMVFFLFHISHMNESMWLVLFHNFTKN